MADGGRGVEPTLDAILQAFADASIGNLSARVPIPAEASSEGQLTQIALALNVVLGDLEHRTETLARSEARFRTAFTQANVGMVITGLDGRILEANRCMEEMLGFGPGELVGVHVVDITYPEDVEASLDAIKRLLLQGADRFTLEKRYLRRDGGFFWAVVTTALVRGSGGEPLQFITQVLDITMHKQAEEELRGSEARHRVLFEANPVPMWVVDSETARFLAVNNAAIAHYGYSREEFLAMTAAEIRPDEDRAKFQAFISAPFTGTNAGGWRHQKKDGSVIPVEVAWQAMTYEGRPARLVLVRDVTERVRAQRELEAAQLRAADSERLAALGGLVSGVAHEIRTPLTYLQSNVGVIYLLLKRAAEEGKSVAEVLPQIEATAQSSSEAVDRINDLVKGLRRFTRREPLARAPTSLSEVAGEAVRLIEATDKSGVRIETDLASVPPVLGAGLQLQQVVLNLVKNAVEASHGTGAAVRVTTRLVPEEKAVVLTVEDRGPGIPPTIEGRLFEPLVTSKPDGTGLGLTISKRIVDDHDGSLTYVTSPQGTVFKVTIPTG